MTRYAHRIRYGFFSSILLAFGSVAQGQSSDTLLAILQEQGILTAEQAALVRKEATQAEEKSFRSRTSSSSWVDSIRLGGEFRGRFEGFYSDSPGFVDRDRLRYRLRFSTTVMMKDSLEVGFRLTSDESANGGSGGDPIASNSTMTDNGSKKLVFFDTAYARWTPKLASDATVALTFGKMDTPFVFSDLVLDSEYTPEGAAFQYSDPLTDKHTFKANGGVFVLDELSGSNEDPYLLGVQARVDSKLNKEWSSTAGLSFLTITNPSALVNGNVPNGYRGNTRKPANSFGAGALVAEFSPWILDAGLTYSAITMPGYPGIFPIRVAAEYVQNPGADDQNSAYALSLAFGKAGKRGTWELAYRYKHLEADAWYEELVDSDQGGIYGAPLPNSGAGTGFGAGTNTRGHVVKGTYSFTDGLSMVGTLYISKLIEAYPANFDSAVRRLQLDLHFKF